MRGRRSLLLSLLSLGTYSCAATDTSTAVAAEEARWVVLLDQSNWAYFGLLDEETNQPYGSVLSFGDHHNGRIFLYLMDSNNVAGVSMTLSEAAIFPSNYLGGVCGGDEGEKATYSDFVDSGSHYHHLRDPTVATSTPSTKSDPEDPRCAKVTLSGTIAPCANDLICQLGKDALFAKHPQMEHWPEDHGFEVHEFDVETIWMIAGFGGGTIIPVDEFRTAKPKHHPAATVEW